MSGYFLYNNAEYSVDQSLKMQSLAITITLNSLLQNLETTKFKTEGTKILSQILIDERWEGIAFVGLYDRDGRIILHSNPNLIGSNETNLIDFDNPKTPHYHRIILGTGEEIFASDSTIRISDQDYTLRVALHLYPTQTLLDHAKTYMFMILTSAVVIILAGVLTLFVLTRIEKMQSRMRELEGVSMLSRILAHEIRNPLGSIKGFAQVLSKKIVEPKLSGHLQVIIRESLRLERLVNELTTYANPQHISPEEFNLQELIEELSEKFKNLFPEIDFQIEFEKLLIRTDRDKVTEIFENLIKNAVDALEGIDRKSIKIKGSQIGGKIKIEIADNGVGMDEETLHRAKEPFFTTKAKGTGLGLAIVDRLCELLKIEFKIESVKGKGTKVWLILPKSL